MRTSKAPEERREEILDAAERLFSVRGFDETTTGDILAAVGIARGTLYYHFKSKEEILDAMVDRARTRCLAAAATVAADRSVPVIERVFATIAASKPMESRHDWIVDQLHRPQNALLHERLSGALLKGLAPIVATVLREGVSDGTFDTPYPLEVAELALSYGVAAFDDEVFGEGETDRRGRARAFLYNLELMLGTVPGSLVRFEPSLARQAAGAGKDA